MNIITARRISQLFFFGLFVWLCLVATVGSGWTQWRGWPVSWFLELDPLVALGTVLTTHSLLPRPRLGAADDHCHYPPWPRLLRLVLSVWDHPPVHRLAGAPLAAAGGSHQGQPLPSGAGDQVLPARRAAFRGGWKLTPESGSCHPRTSAGCSRDGSGDCRGPAVADLAQGHSGYPPRARGRRVAGAGLARPGRRAVHGADHHEHPANGVTGPDSPGPALVQPRPAAGDGPRAGKMAAGPPVFRGRRPDRGGLSCLRPAESLDPALLLPLRLPARCAARRARSRHPLEHPQDQRALH